MKLQNVLQHKLLRFEIKYFLWISFNKNRNANRKVYYIRSSLQNDIIKSLCMYVHIRNYRIENHTINIGSPQKVVR